MALYVTPSSCPASPAESFEKPLAAFAMSSGRTEEFDHRDTVSRIKSRPPSGIMFAVFRAVKQFLTLLTLFSLEIYSWMKIAKNKANMVHSAGLQVGRKSSGSRKKVSFGGKVLGHAFRRGSDWLTEARLIMCSVVHS
jgi:hypothetical protein